MPNLTELTERRIEIEEAIVNGGFHRDALEFRAAWRHASNECLEDVLEEFAPVAAAASAHPRRFVVQANEPLPLEEIDRAEIARLSLTGLLNPTAVDGCRWNAERAEEIRRRERMN